VAEDPPRQQYKPDVTVGYGLRVPMFIVSPWVEPGSVHHNVWDHTSILQTILKRFCATSNPYLSDRVRSADHIGKALSRSAPRIDIPKAPKPRAARSAPDILMRQRYFGKADLTRQDTDWHEFMTVLGRLTRG
jgi:phospholipase C